MLKLTADKRIDRTKIICPIILSDYIKNIPAARVCHNQLVLDNIHVCISETIHHINNISSTPISQLIGAVTVNRDDISMLTCRNEDATDVAIYYLLDKQKMN